MIRHDDCGRNGRRCRLYDAEFGLGPQHRRFLRLFHCHGRGPGRFKILSPILVLGRYCRDNHCRDDDVCGSLGRFRWCISAYRGRLLLREDLSYVVVLVGVHHHPAPRCGVG
jgi:hypothetical protein